MSNIYSIRVAPGGAKPVDKRELFQQYGFEEFKGVGEATFTAEFGLAFLLKPVMYFGAELAPGQALVPGKYPKVNVMVREWHTTTRGPSTYWVGAEFILVVSGPPTLEGTAIWQVEGAGVPLTEIGA